MRAEQLISKKVVRTYHTKCAGGVIDRSFMDKPILIHYANESHIIYEWLEKDFKGGKRLLSYEYCDDNWIDYDCLMFMAQKPRNNAIIYEDKIIKIA